MTYLGRENKPFCMPTAFMAAMVVLAFALAAVPAPAQTYRVLYKFGSNANDPLQPRGPDAIAQGRDGNLYTTSANGGTSNNGTVFKVTPSGTLSVVSNLGSPGNTSFSGVTLGTDGNFYGTTELNGEGPGTVFKVTSSGVETGLHIFGNTGDGGCPFAAPIEGADGNYYGTTTTVCGFGSQGTVYKVTSAGVLTTLHTFTGPDGSDIQAPVVQGSDGNFYGASVDGGTSNDGVIFKMTPSGTVTVIHNFAGTDGSTPIGLIQASDGNFYGVTYTGGSSNAGVIFKIIPSGTYTVLHNFNGTTDGNGPPSNLFQATDAKLYGVAHGGSSNLGTIYSITTTGTFRVLVTFGGANGSTPNSPLKQNTNGVLYGDTYAGGDLSLCSGNGCGEFYSLNIGAKPFINLESTSGKVGSKVGILGQGFSSSSVVKFNGVKATTVTRTGTTFLLATVPSGASDGKVTVTTGSTTLISPQTFIVHNSWRSGAAMPTAVYNPATGVLNNEVYVVGGNTTTQTAAVQIYNPVTNSWSTGVSLPIATANAPAAVVDGVLYVIGGYTTAVTNAVWAYDPKTKTWSGKAAMSTARDGAVAVMDKNIIYVAGGYNGSTFIATVESYNPATDTWKEEAPMLGSKDLPVAGLIGSTIVVADGAIASGEITGDTEGYNATTNTWTTLATDPTARTGACGAVISSRLYDAGGYINNDGAATTVNESFTLSTNNWTTTLAPMPLGTLFSGSAVHNGQLYCFGGESTWAGNAINNVQIYQP